MVSRAIVKRRHLVYLIGIVAAIGCFAAVASQAEADHGADTLAVAECQAYEHVLETDDQLYICRYEATELEHPPGSPIGVGFAIARLQDTTPGPTVIHSNVSIPRLGFALVGFYFADSDPDKPTFSDGGIEVIILENPTLFPVPLESTPEAPEFNSTADLQATADELVLDLPRIMLRLEESDIDLATNSIVVGTGITQLGSAYVTDAYGPLETIASGAFLPETISAGSSVTGPAAPGFITGLASSGRSSGFATGIEGLGGFLGLPYMGSLLMFMAAMMGLVAYVVKTYGGEGSEPTIIFWVMPVFLMGAYLGDGIILFAAAVLMVALTLFIGGAMVIQRVVST